MKITAHLHGRIDRLIKEAIDRGLIISGDRTDGDRYTIVRDGSLPESNTAIGTGTILLAILGRIDSSP